MRICSSLQSRDEVLSASADQPVWRCHDLVGGHEIVLREFMTDPPRPCSDATGQFLLHRRLDGAGFVPAEDLIWRGGRIVGFTTAYLGRRTLADTCGELTADQLMQVLVDISLALFYLHSLEMLHGDLNLSNVLITLAGGRVRTHLADLGFAVPIGSQSPTEIRGPKGSIAPEVFSGEPLTAASDVFSFGRLGVSVLGAPGESDLGRCVSRVFRECTRNDPSARPQDMGSIFLSLKAIARAHNLDMGTSTRLLPPLRPTAIEFPLRGLRDALRQCHGRGVVAYLGPSGYGKSHMLREMAHWMQSEGLPTMRISGVSSLTEIIEPLDHALKICRSEGVKNTPTVFVETSPGTVLKDEEIVDFAQWARAASLQVVVELRTGAAQRPASDVILCVARRFSERGCLSATSHLLENSAIAPAHARSLSFATGGIPRLVRESMAAYIESGRRHRGEALAANMACERASGYWRGAVSSLAPHRRQLLRDATAFDRPFRLDSLPVRNDLTNSTRSTVEDLCDLGWLTRIRTEDGDEKFWFVAASAITCLRAMDNQAPPEFSDQASSTSRADPVAVGRDIARIRRFLLRRKSQPPMSDYRSVCDAFGRLGSFRRRRRWARCAIRSFPVGKLFEPSSTTLADYFRLLDYGTDPAEKQVALRSLLEGDCPMSLEMRGEILGELGSALLHSNEPDAAYRVLIEAAAHWSKGSRSLSGLARIQNRIGVTRILQRDWEAARKQLAKARRSALDAHDEDTLRRVDGNFGWIYHAIGDPAAALIHLRRVSRQSVRSREHTEYLSTLINETRCLIDLGRGEAAERHARLSSSLAEMLSDTRRMGYAAGNLGRLLTMKCHAGPARFHLERALRIWRLEGDRPGIAATVLNLGRLCMTARLYDDALGFYQGGLGIYSELHSNEGVWDSYRLLGQQALALEQYDEAKQFLDRIPTDHPELPTKDRIDLLLLRADWALWTGDLDTADALLAIFTLEPVVSNVHPMTCRVAIAQGHLALLRGDQDLATDHLGRAATLCRTSQRHDLLLDAILVRASLAIRVRNEEAARRYLTYIRRQTKVMQEELK